MKNTFAKMLKFLRTQQNWKQSDLAQLLHTTQRRISYWESSNIEPDLDTLWMIADIFDVSIDYLIGRKEY